LMENRINRDNQQAIGAAAPSETLSVRQRARRSFIGVSVRARLRLGKALSDERGQGTTEYAILVGVLAVIAMIAIAAFRGKVTELWEAISSGINGL
jgi:Flp pilus assembly pilin Flp